MLLVSSALFRLQFDCHSQVPPSSQISSDCSLQVHFPMMNIGHLLHQCCWLTRVDSSLRCAPALRNRRNITCRSYIHLCLLEPFLPPRLFFHSSIHQLLSIGTTFLLRLVLSCLLPCQLCILSMRSHTRRRTTCRCSRSGHSTSLSHRARGHSPDPLVLVRHRTSFR